MRTKTEDKKVPRAPTALRWQNLLPLQTALVRTLGSYAATVPISYSGALPAKQLPSRSEEWLDNQ